MIWRIWRIFHDYVIRVGGFFYAIRLVDNKHYVMCSQWNNVKLSSFPKLTLMENGLQDTFDDFDKRVLSSLFSFVYITPFLYQASKYK